MARSDQYMGLNQRARKLVNRKVSVQEHGVTVYPGGKKKGFSRWRRIRLARKEVIGKIEGAWIPVVAQLHRYTMPDGRVFEEFVQATPWCGGPNYFIALKDKKSGKPLAESLWTEEEMNG